MPGDLASMTFRVRGIPATCNDIKSARNYISNALSLDKHPIVYSVGLEPRGDTRVATLNFRDLPEDLKLQDDEWAHKSGLSLDTHFKGITPLNMVAESVPERDRIE